MVLSAACAGATMLASVGWQCLTSHVSIAQQGWVPELYLERSRAWFHGALQTVQARYGTPTGGVILMLIPAVTMLCSTTVSLSTNSR